MAISMLRQKRIVRNRMNGQAMVEFTVVASFVLVPMFWGIAYLGKIGNSQHKMHEAARYAAWERTVWSADASADNYKSNERIGNETLSRVLADGEKLIQTDQDAQRVEPSERSFAPIMYISDGQGGQEPIIQEESNRYLSLNSTDEDAVSGDGALGPLNQALQLLGTFGFSLNEKGLQTSRFSWKYDWIPALDVGEPMLTVTSHNTLLTESWNANSSEQIKDRLGNVVATRLIGDVGVEDGLQALSILGFQDFDEMDLGKIDTDRVPCQRIANASGPDLGC